MKIAFISDIHGNVTALQNVLKEINNKNVDTIICLGDLVGYGPYPNEVIETIRKNKILTIKGNYDASVVDNEFSFIRDNEINSFSMPWAFKNLKEENMNFLKQLPAFLTLNFEGINIGVYHGSPRKINEYLIEDSDAMYEVLDEFKGDIIICAHTHIPYIKQVNNKIIVNDGSVGKPKIGEPVSTYIIMELHNNMKKEEILNNITLCKVKYDFKDIVETMHKNNFPEKLIKSFINGKE